MRTCDRGLGHGYHLDPHLRLQPGSLDCKNIRSVHVEEEVVEEEDEAPIQFIDSNNSAGHEKYLKTTMSTCLEYKRVSNLTEDMYMHVCTF